MVLPVQIVMLADRPELADGVGELLWREWGDEPGREKASWWVKNARRCVRRTGVPVAFAALEGADKVVGCVSLLEFDLPERRDRSPWLTGMLVQPDRRDRGIGEQLVDRLHQWALPAGVSRIWVATGGRAVRSYERCGFRVAELVTKPGGQVATVLVAAVRGPGAMPGATSSRDPGRPGPA